MPYLVGDIINKESSMGAPIVEVADALVLFLACCVPDLKLDGG